MKTTKWITIDADGKHARITTKSTRVEPWEICFPLTINIPDAYFERPQFSANITFPDRQRTDTEIDVQGIEDAVLQSTGIELSINIQEPNT